MTDARPRVWITGVGLVTPLGADAPTTWRALLEGRVGIGPIRRFDAGGFPVRIGAEALDPDPAHLPPGIRARAGRQHLFALAAAGEALADAGIAPTHASAASWGCVVGAGMLGVEYEELAEFQRRAAPDGSVLAARLTDPIDRRDFARHQAVAGLGLLAARFGMHGPAFALHTACASGGQAVGAGLQLIRRGAAERVLVGGFDAMLTPVGLSAFCLLGALSTDNECPERASRPFDRTRNGFVLGEGAGFLVLEDAASAQRRGARPYAELAGEGNALSSYRITDPHPAGFGPIQAMRTALRDAGEPTDAVDYVNAHGTSTPMNDRSESAAMRAVFGDHVARVAVSSTKSMTGHLIAAAGAVEAAICALALRDGVAPPNPTLVEPDPDCDLSIVVGGPLRRPLRIALSNSFGFGGANSCLVFRAVSSSPSPSPSPSPIPSPSPSPTSPPTRDPSPGFTDRAGAGARARARAGVENGEAIVVTGVGALCGLGHDLDTIWTAILAGRSAVRPIRQWAAGEPPFHQAAEVEDLDPAGLVSDRKTLKMLRRSHVFGLFAGMRAVTQAGFLAARAGLGSDDDAARFNDRSGLYVGTTGTTYQDQYDFLPLLARSEGELTRFATELPRVVHPMWLLRTLLNNVLCHLGIQTGFTGPHACVASHATSGVLAVAEGLAALRAGEIDRAVAVAHDTSVEPQVLQAYATLDLLARAAPRPFDRDRDGCVLGEGAAALALECAGRARGRGAPILGELLGSAAAGDGAGVLEHRADGDGTARVLAAALADARIAPEQVALIVAHGDGSAADAAESAALRRVFGAGVPPVTAFKWSSGHLFAVSGILDAALALRALRAGEAPGIATLRALDPRCDLPVSPRPQPLRGDVAVVLSRGFAGSNAALVVRTPRP